MTLEKRRKVLRAASGLAFLAPISKWAIGAEAPKAHSPAEFVRAVNAAWMTEHDQALARAKEREKRGEFASLAPPEQLVPFSDWDYYYTKGMPARWTPNPGQPFKAVTVPAGFVTDLTSIPQGAWSLGLRPEGRYAYAAIVHDYLYWIQDPSWTRETADKIFLFAMEDSKVPTVERDAFYGVLRAVGGHAWDTNATLKRDGERRFLKKYPPTFTTTWKDWKATPGVFED